MTKARLDGLYLLLLGSVVFLLLGVAGERTSRVAMQDFKVVYYPAQCLLQHCDPYNEREVLRIYEAEGGGSPFDTENQRQFATRYIYLPTAFFFTVPFAMLPWGPAHMLWLTVTAGSLIFASFLAWNLGANYAPVISGCLIGFMLANSEVIVVLCNAGGIAVSLCVVAVWCFMRGRFVPAGILCLAISLAVKPQDAGLFWLYFLLAGGAYRRYALQTLLATAGFSLPGVVWVWHTAPQWMQEWQSNVLAFSARGGLTDPGPASANGYGLSMMVNLQTVFGSFWDDPRIYNPASYFVFAPLFLAWVFTTLRSSQTPKKHWLALAAIGALSMLPVYHRLNDAKLLMLTVPACAMLSAEGGLIGWLALLVNTIAFVLTGDLPWVILVGLISHFHVSTTGSSGQILRSLLVLPTPLFLLVMAVFYLWVYVASSSSPTASAKSGSPGELTHLDSACT
jgi:hypothetical protein